MGKRRGGRRGFLPPVRALGGGWQLTIDVEERELLIRLMDELSELLRGPEDSPLIARLFPEAYPDDADKEAEYQRLMREELVTSRLCAIESVTATLGPSAPPILDEGQTIAFLQSVNAIRLVLATLLGIDDDDDADRVDRSADAATSPERQLYDFLSWLLEWTVRALSPD